MTSLLRATLVLALLSGCRGGTTLVGQCTSDSDCAAGFHCGLSGPFQGDCLCSTDAVCPQDGGPAFCNPAGRCQSKVGCASNQDCAGGSFCDLGLSLCVLAPACGSDLDCSLGYICSAASATCVPGCHSNGDCTVGVPCVCGNGAECRCPLPDAGAVDPASYDQRLCEVGTCNASTCADDTSLCPYNDLCVGGGDGGLSVCQPDPRTDVLCQNCAGSVAGHSCGTTNNSGANFCLIDLTFGNLYCGVDCSHGQTCPSGYSCDDVIILTQSPCGRDQDCAPTGSHCDPDAGTGCPLDTRCAGAGATGQCAGFCEKAEDATTGFCSCVTDTDCPKDICDSVTNTCSISQQPCDPSVSAICTSVIKCVDFGGARGCYIGQNCAPTHGLKCPLTNGK